MSNKNRDIIKLIEWISDNYMEYKECMFGFTLKNDEGMNYKKCRYARPTKRDPYPKLNIIITGNKIIRDSMPNGQKPFKTFYMHRLVAQAFLKNELNLPIVDHINSHTIDYRVENLRWCSHSENNTGKRPKMGSDKLYDIFEHKKLI